MNNNTKSAGTVSAAYSSYQGRVHNEWIPTRVSKTQPAAPPINSVSVGHVVVGKNAPQELDE